MSAALKLVSPTVENENDKLKKENKDLRELIGLLVKEKEQLKVVARDALSFYSSKYNYVPDKRVMTFECRTIDGYYDYETKSFYAGRIAMRAIDKINRDF